MHQARSLLLKPHLLDKQIGLFYRKTEVCFRLLLVPSPGGSSPPRTSSLTVGPVGPKNTSPPGAAAVESSAADIGDEDVRCASVARGRQLVLWGAAEGKVARSIKTALLASGLSVLAAHQMDDKLDAWACQAGLSIKNRPASAGEVSLGFHPWVGKIPWRRAGQSTPVSLPGESPGQRSQAGHGPQGYSEWDRAEAALPACVPCGRRFG